MRRSSGSIPTVGFCFLGRMIDGRRAPAFGRALARRLKTCLEDGMNKKLKKPPASAGKSKSSQVRLLKPPSSAAAKAAPPDASRKTNPSRPRRESSIKGIAARLQRPLRVKMSEDRRERSKG